MKHWLIRALARLVRPVVIEAYEARPRVEACENGIRVWR